MKKVLFILLFPISYCLYAQQMEIKPGDSAVKYKLKIVTSKESVKAISVADLNGKIIVLQWFNIYCQGSTDILKSLNNYYKKYGKEVSFYAVSPNTLNSIMKFKEKNFYDFLFCSDAGKLDNKYFPYTAEAHTVIINRKGICLHHGLFNLTDAVLDTLIKSDSLPFLSQKESMESYKLKQFRNEFEEYRKAMDSYSQTGFKLKPYKSNSLIDWKHGTDGKDYYGYNQSIYTIYRDGLLLKDDQIIISDTLNRKLSSMDTSNLYNVGFNIRKDNPYSNYHYQKVFKTYLDSAFGLNTVLLKKRVAVNEQGAVSKGGKKKIQCLEFLPEREKRSVTCFQITQKKNILKAGFKIGLGGSKYVYNNDQYQGKNILALNAGLFTQIRLNNFLSLQSGINYQTNGSRGNYAKLRLHNLNTPINLMFTTSQQKPLGLFMKLGGYYSYNFSGNVKGQDLSYSKAIEKNLFGWTYSLGFWLGDKVAYEFSYNRGLSNIIKNSAFGDVKEKIWMLTEIYCF
jgi:peroxiredoxin